MNNSMFFSFLVLNIFLISCQPKQKEDPPHVSHVGNWSTDCVVADDGVTKVIHHLNISESPQEVSLIIKMYPYNSVSCSDEEQVGEFDITASYSRAEDEYTTTIISYGYTPKTIDNAQLMTDSSFCRTSLIPIQDSSPAPPRSWLIDGREDILGKECMIGGVDYSLKVNEEKIYSVLRRGTTLSTTNYPNYTYNLVP